MGCVLIKDKLDYQSISAAVMLHECMVTVQKKGKLNLSELYSDHTKKSYGNVYNIIILLYL